MNKKPFTYVCRHVEQVPDDGHWEDSSSSPCNLCLKEYYDSLPEEEILTYTDEEIDSIADMHQQIENYGFEKSFERYPC